MSECLVITKALLVIVAMVAVAHPFLVAFAFDLLALGAAHLAAVLVVGELGAVGVLAALIARAVRPRGWRAAGLPVGK